MEELEDINVGDLHIKADTSDPTGAVQLRWRGKSNDRYPGKVLGPFFASAMAAAVARGKPLELYFEELDHFNSSTITWLIQLIQEARAKGVKLRYVYNQALKWQKLSFDAMRVFTKDGALELRSI